MQVVDRSELRNDDAPVGSYRAPPANFEPKHFILCEYRFSISPYDTTGRKLIWFDSEINTYDANMYNVLEFASKALKGTPNKYKLPNPSLPENGMPLDFGVNAPCYIFIKISNENNWMFSRTRCAITAKNQAVSADEDGEVYHIDASGNYQTAPHNKSDCRLIYFPIYRRKDLLPRYYNLNIRLVDRGFSIETIIDPDIPNTGASPFPPGRNIFREGKKAKLKTT